MIWADTLKKTRVFKDLTSGELDLIEKLVDERSCTAKTKVVKEGDSSTNFYICVEGELAIQIDVPGRGTIVTGTISDNNVFGWSALATIPHYGASVVTRKDSRMLVLSGKNLKGIFENHPRIGYCVMRNLIEVISSRLQDVRFALASCITDYRKG